MKMQRSQQSSESRRRWRLAGGLRRSEWVALVLAATLSWLAVPTPVYAACGPRDLTTCVNAAQYAFWQGVAGELWSINRVLLTLAYQLDVFRAWLIETVFTSVFQIVADTISPVLAPMATIAVILGVLFFLIMPVIGRVEVVNIRRALIWIVIAPSLLAISGPGLARAEQFRTTMGQTMFSAAQSIGSEPRFGAQSTEMNTATTSLYPFSGCSGGVLERPFTDGGSASGVYMDDLAASMMYSDAEDIHCPTEGSGPGTELPDGFYSPPADYATTEAVSDMDSSRSAEWVAKIQRGVTRLLMGIIPSFLAVMNAIIQLLFALALVLLWIALPLGLLLVFFTETATGVTGLARRMVSVLQTSWSSSLLLGIVFVALLAASNLGNVAAFVGLSIAGIGLTLFIIFVAVNAFMSSVQAIAQTVSMGTGISGNVAKRAFAGATGGAAAVALTGAQATKKAGEMGLSYAVARRARTSRRYALGAAAGRIGGVAKVGSLASALGIENEITDGIYTGHRGVHNRDGLRAIRRFALTDAAKVDEPTGMTMRQREEQRDLQWAAERARRGSNLEQAGRILSRGVQAARHPVESLRAGARVVWESPGVERLQELSGDAARGAWERVREGRDSVTERAGDAPSLGNTLQALGGAASLGFRAGPRSARMISNGRGGLRYLPRLAADRLPAWSLTDQVSNVREGKLLQLGYHLQYNDDGTVTFWHPDGPATGPSAVSAVNKPRTSPRQQGPATGGVPVSAAVPPSSSPGQTRRSRVYGVPAASPALQDSQGAVPAASGAEAIVPPVLAGAATGAPPASVDRVVVGAHTRAKPQARPASAAEVTPTSTGAQPIPLPGASLTTSQLTPRVWHRQRRRASLEIARNQQIEAARQELTRAEERLALVQQGAVVGLEENARQSVAAAQHALTAVEQRGIRSRSRPSPVRGTLRVQRPHGLVALHQGRMRLSHDWNYRPGMELPPGIQSPAPVMLQEAASRNEALAIDARGYAVPTALPNDALPAPDMRLVVPANEVHDLDGLLQAGYQVYQAPDSDDVTLWPREDTPGVHWINPGTPEAKPDLVRERRRLGQQGLLDMPPPPRPLGPRATRARQGGRSQRRRASISQRRNRP